jgi:hypothetical protein
MKMENAIDYSNDPYVALLEARVAYLMRLIDEISVVEPEVFQSPSFQAFQERERLAYN